MVLGRQNLRRLSLIDRYLARTIAVPLLGTLILAAMLLVLDKMLRLFDFVVDAGGPVSVVWRMLANLLPEYFSLGIPIGLMLGILLAFRKLALSSELDALRGIGVGLRPAAARALRLRGRADAAEPVHRRLARSPGRTTATRGCASTCARARSGASIKVGEFNQLGQRLTLRIDRSENEGTELHGIFVQVDDRSGTHGRGDRRAGPVPVDRRSRHILFRLEKGRLIQDSPKFPTPRTLSFDSYDLPINLPRVDQFPAARARGAGGADAPRAVPRRLSAATCPSEHRLGAQANLHFRLVEVLMMLMLPLLAVALAVPPKRSSSALGIFVAIVIVVAYHKVNQYAEQAGGAGPDRPDACALWIPLLLLVGADLLDVPRARPPAGRPADRRARAGVRQVAARSVRRLLPKARTA